MTKKSNAMADIQAVMETHKTRLMAVPGVIGVAIGESSDRKLCICVLVTEDNEQVRQHIPSRLENYPVEIRIAGHIKAL